MRSTCKRPAPHFPPFPLTTEHFKFGSHFRAVTHLSPTTARTNMPRFDKLAADSAFLDSISASFNKPSAFPDITITCGAQKFLCHKLILTHRSKWFQKALNGGFEAGRTCSTHQQQLTVITGVQGRYHRAA